MFQIEEKISRFINFKQMQNDNSNTQEFCGVMNPAWHQNAEGMIALDLFFQCCFCTTGPYFCENNLNFSILLF